MCNCGYTTETSIVQTQLLLPKKKVFPVIALHLRVYLFNVSYLKRLRHPWAQRPYRRDAKAEKKHNSTSYFQKIFLFFAKEALGVSVCSTTRVQSSCIGDKNHRTSPLVTCGPHPCLPRRNVWGSYSAAVTEHGRKRRAQCCWAQSVRKECYCTACGWPLDPA